MQGAPRPASEVTTRGGTSCPVCLQPAALGADLGEYRLFDCTTCGCWSSDALTRGALTSFEPADYFEHADADRDKWESLLERLARRARRPARVLDVGCGTGAFLAFMGERGGATERVGIELDPDRAAQARARNPGATVYAGDALATLHDLAGPFDLVTLWDVFEHVPRPREVLVEIARLLAPDGVAYVQTIHERSALPLFGRLVYRLTAARVRYPVRRTHDAHHLVFFTMPGLQTVADAAALEIVEHWFDRLARRRMDGHPLVTALASLVLALENAAGGGLFVNLLLERRHDAP